MLKHLYLCFVIWRNARMIRKLDAELSGDESTPIRIPPIAWIGAIIIGILLIEIFISTS